MARDPFAVEPEGAIVRPLYARRDVEHLAVSENELRQISTMNALAALFVSMATGTLFYGLAILQVWWMEEGLSPQGEAVAKVLVPVLALMCLGFTVAAGVAWQSRRDQIARIRSESEGRTPPGRRARVSRPSPTSRG